MAALELVVVLGVVILGCGLAARRTGVAELIVLLAGTCWVQCLRCRRCTCHPS